MSMLYRRRSAAGSFDALPKLKEPLLGTFWPEFFPCIPVSQSGWSIDRASLHKKPVLDQLAKQPVAPRRPRLQDAGILQLALQRKCVVLVAKVFRQENSVASKPLCIKTAIRMMAFLVVGILLAFNLSSLYRLEEASVLLLLFSLALVMLTAGVLAGALLYYGGKGLLQGAIAVLRFLPKVFVSSSELHLGKTASMVHRRVSRANDC